MLTQRAPFSPQRPGLAISAALAVALNGAALYIGAGLTTPVAARTEARAPAMQIVPAWVPPPLPAAPTATAQTLPASPSAPAPRAVARAEPVPSQPKLAQKLPPDPPEQATEAAAEAAEMHFYRFDEVELPAAPDTDWDIDAVALDVNGVDRIVVDLYVSSSGEILECRIVEPPMGDELRSLLESRLRTTVLKPAIRGGQPVPSERRIEMTVS